MAEPPAGRSCAIACRITVPAPLRAASFACAASTPAYMARTATSMRSSDDVGRPPAASMISSCRLHTWRSTSAGRWSVPTRPTAASTAPWNAAGSTPRATTPNRLVRAYAAPIVLDRKKTCLAAIWRRAWETLEHKRAKAVLIEASSTNEAPLALVDTRRMEQVFRNLFENAFDACGDDIEVTIAFEHVPGELLICIRDNGPGMPPEVKDCIFEAFFTTKATGTGLGMAIVHRIIEAHAGTIRVTDHSPGTEFEIRLETPTPA